MFLNLVEVMGVWLGYFQKLTKTKYKIFDMQSVSFLQYYYLKQIGLNVGFKNLNNICLINNFNKIKNIKFKRVLYSLLTGLYQFNKI